MCISTLCYLHLRIEVLWKRFDFLFGNPHGICALPAWSIQMGRAKVVYKKVANGRPAESKDVVAASSASSPVPVPKKRGRPRKIPKEEVPVSVAVVEEKKPDVLSNDISQLSVSDSGKKRSRTMNGDDSSEVRTEKNDENKRDHSEEPIKPVITRRQGSRRKSEPRRAAGAFMDSNWCRAPKIPTSQFVFSFLFSFPFLPPLFFPFYFSAVLFVGGESQILLQFCSDAYSAAALRWSKATPKRSLRQGSTDFFWRVGFKWFIFILLVVVLPLAALMGEVKGWGRGKLS